MSELPPLIAEADNPVPPEAEDLYQRVVGILRNPKAKSSWQSSGWLIVTAILFGVSFAGSMDLVQLLGIVGVLFVHELGHLLGMLACGYRDTQMFFIPFFGAAVTAREHAAPVWQRAMILLLGPAPGILMGTVAAFVAPIELPLVQSLLLWAIAINAFNLLPFVPLDGGRILDLLLFGNIPWLSVAFRLFAILGLGGLAVWSGSIILGVLPLFMLLALGQVYRQAVVARDFRRHAWHLPERVEDMNDAQAREVFTWVLKAFPVAPSAQVLAREMRNLHVSAVSRQPSLLVRFTWLGLYGMTILIAIIGFLALSFRMVDHQRQLDAKQQAASSLRVNALEDTSVAFVGEAASLPVHV